MTGKTPQHASAGQPAAPPPFHNLPLCTSALLLFPFKCSIILGLYLQYVCQLMRSSSSPFILYIRPDLAYGIAKSTPRRNKW